MKVELIDLKLRYKEERKDILKIIDKTLKKGALVLTPELENFEKKISIFTKTKKCLGLNSGTDALMMALWSLGIGKGDEVITSPISFIATIGAIIHVGAIPVFVDTCDDFNMDPDLIEKKITKKTKAIIPVHWSGRMCDMKKISDIAKKYKINVIEDAAQAIGAFYKNCHSGTFSDVAAFSSHPLKNLNAIGDGGFITTNNINLYNKIKLYRNHGLKKRDDVKIFGVNSRLDIINSEILKYRLKKLKKIIKKREENIKIYSKYLSKNQYIQLPVMRKDYQDTHTLFLIKVRKKRNQLHSYLTKKGIQSMIYYGTPLHLHHASKILGYKKNSLPVAEKLASQVLALPHHQYLKLNQIKYISEIINKFFK